jgi:hypothetical protein
VGAAVSLRREVELAHEHVQNAQRIAYDPENDRPGLLVRLALNRCETSLIKLLVRRLR